MPECEAEGAARDFADDSVVDEDGLAMASDCSAGEAQADEPSRWVLGVDGFERGRPDEVALVELHRPAQAAAVRIRPFVHVLAVEAKSGLEPERIARS